MADFTTSVLGLVNPEVGGSNNTWGTKINANFLLLDGLFNTSTGHDHSGTTHNGANIPPDGLKGLSGNGFTVAISSAAFVQRAITARTLGGLATADGDGVAADPTLWIDPTNATAVTALAGDDVFLVYDTSASALRKVVRSDLFAGLAYPVTAHGNASGAVALDTVGGSRFFSMTQTGGITLSFSNGAAGTIQVLYLTNGGAFTFTHPSGTTFAGGTAPSLTAAGVDKLVYTSTNGTVWDCTALIDVR